MGVSETDPYVDYDQDADVLYVSYTKPRAAVGEDLGRGIVLRLDLETREPVGFTVVGLSRHFSPENLHELFETVEAAEQALCGRARRPLISDRVRDLAFA